LHFFPLVVVSEGVSTFAKKQIASTCELFNACTYDSGIRVTRYAPRTAKRNS
jgi:hypothetical protein